MAPEIRVFIDAMRRGRSSSDAMMDYCWAKCVVPIDKADWEAGRHRNRAHPRRSMACAKAADAFDDGASDEQIAAEFEDGLALDRDYDLLWRAMEKDERPTSGQLIGSMSAAGKECYLDMLARR